LRGWQKGVAGGDLGREKVGPKRGAGPILGEKNTLGERVQGLTESWLNQRGKKGGKEREDPKLKKRVICNEGKQNARVGVASPKTKKREREGGGKGEGTKSSTKQNK